MFKDKVIAVTGGSGFLGTAIIKKLGDEPREIRAMGHSEKLMTQVQRELPECKWLMGDILDPPALHRLIDGADIVIHCAAQKHIPVGEAQPTYTAMTNILGTKNVIDACILANIEEVVGISTDKAFEPLTIYGMSKYFMERMFVENNREAKKCGWNTRFYTCRYGNVLFSSGSVFEIWDKCGREKKPFKITDPNMTRFFFTVDEAVKTIFSTFRKKDLERPYIPKMKAIKMGKALDIFMEHYGVRKMEIIGNRGNEKIHEGLGIGITSDKVEQFSRSGMISLFNKLGLLQ